MSSSFYIGFMYYGHSRIRCYLTCFVQIVQRLKCNGLLPYHLPFFSILKDRTKWSSTMAWISLQLLTCPSVPSILILNMSSHPQAPQQAFIGSIWNNTLSLLLLRLFTMQSILITPASVWEWRLHSYIVSNFTLLSSFPFHH